MSSAVNNALFLLQKGNKVFIIIKIEDFVIFKKKFRPKNNKKEKEEPKSKTEDNCFLGIFLYAYTQNLNRSYEIR